MEADGNWEFRERDKCLLFSFSVGIFQEPDQGTLGRKSPFLVAFCTDTLLDPAHCFKSEEGKCFQSKYRGTALPEQYFAEQTHTELSGKEDTSMARLQISDQGSNI